MNFGDGGDVGPKFVCDSQRNLSVSVFSLVKVWEEDVNNISLKLRLHYYVAVESLPHSAVGGVNKLNVLPKSYASWDNDMDGILTTRFVRF